MFIDVGISYELLSSIWHLCILLFRFWFYFDTASLWVSFVGSKTRKKDAKYSREMYAQHVLHAPSFQMQFSIINHQIKNWHGEKTVFLFRCEYKTIHFCHHMSDNYVDSDLIWQVDIIIWQVDIIFRQVDLMIWQVDIITKKSSFWTIMSTCHIMMSTCQIFMLTCKILCRLVR